MDHKPLVLLIPLFVLIEFPFAFLAFCSYLGGSMYLMYKLPFVECLMFGALISATDPVTVLSIFQVPLLFHITITLIPKCNMLMLVDDATGQYKFSTLK